MDLRQPAALEAALKLAKLQLDVPTYIVAECVLVYMRPDESNAVVRWLAEHLQQAAFVLYEQVGYVLLAVLQSTQCAVPQSFLCATTLRSNKFDVEVLSCEMQD